MHELVPIQPNTISDQQVKIVNDRDLHNFLGVKKYFSNWTKTQIEHERQVIEQNPLPSLVHKTREETTTSMDMVSGSIAESNLPDNYQIEMVSVAFDQLLGKDALPALGLVEKRAPVYEQPLVDIPLAVQNGQPLLEVIKYIMDGAEEIAA